MATRHIRPDDRTGFEIAIVCALQIESDAVEAVFDEFWDEDDDNTYGKALGDHNFYTLGRIGRHNVVLAYMPGMGKGASASTAARLLTSFSHIRLGLVVGICGGVPQPVNQTEDIFLGDVIVSTAIVQFDFGRQVDDRFIRKDTLHDNLGRPNQEIRAFIHKLQGRRGRSSLQKHMATSITDILAKQDFQTWHKPGAGEDQLFQANYQHEHHDTKCTVCIHSTTPESAIRPITHGNTCTQPECDVNRLVKRTRNESSSGPDAPALYFGLMASGDAVMKSATRRDQIASEEGVIGFEMEGAGVWDNFPTIVIKGVCDYADSHKNKKWQKYAAVTAAACAKAMLREWPGSAPASGGASRPNDIGNISSRVNKPDPKGERDGRGGDTIFQNMYGKGGNQVNSQIINGDLVFQ